MHITFLKLSFQTKRKNLTTRRKVIIVMDSIVLRVSNRKLNRKERSDAATGLIYIYIYEIKYSNNRKRFVRISSKIPRFNFHDFKFVSTLSARIFVEYSNYT